MSEEQKLTELLVVPVRPRGLGPEPEPTEEIETVDKAEVQPDDHVRAQPIAVTLQNLFRHPDAHPVVLDLCLLKKYGHEWYGWEPETLERRIPQDFRVAEVSALSLAKIQAVRTLHMVDSFWKQWEVFGWVTLALNGIFPDFEVMQAPTVAQCMIAVEIANQIRDDVLWSSEVVAYLGVVHHHDGIFVPQPPLAFVSVDHEDFSVEPAEVRMLWPVVRETDRMPTGNTITGEQLRRMLACHRALEENRVSLRGQLPLVSHV